MIRSFYGLDENPFSMREIELLPHQQEVYETLRVHSQQGGLCVIVGVPGTGKTVIKDALKLEGNNNKRLLVVTVSRTLHTYTNTIKVLCEAFNITYEGTPFKCERRLIDEAYSLNSQGKMLVTIIDEAHLMDMEVLRKLRLLFEDFPKNHNLILIGQPELLGNLSLSVNQDIKSRVTYSNLMRRINSDDMKAYILNQIDRVGLGHNVFTEESIDLIVRSADGVLRKARNLCVSCLLEGVRNRTKTIDLDNVNRVLIQPHWRSEIDIKNLAF